MGDTLPFVYWTLQRPCPYRTGEGWELPRTAYEQLKYMKTYSSCSDRDDVFEGFCLSAHTTLTLEASKHEQLGIPEEFVRIPVGGFSVEEKLLGSLENACRTCSECEANVQQVETGSNHAGCPALAGCTGRFIFRMGDRELNEDLLDRIEKESIDFENTFFLTKPLLYGLWIGSPLNSRQTRALRALLGDLSRGGSLTDRDIPYFLESLKTSEETGLGLRVEVLPPGHADLGRYMIFPHCPRCKASSMFSHPAYPPKPRVPGGPAEDQLTDSEIQALITQADSSGFFFTRPHSGATGDSSPGYGRPDSTREGTPFPPKGDIEGATPEAVNAGTSEDEEEDLVKCDVCGLEYNPKKTARSLRDEDEFPDLEAETGGRKKYISFLKRY
ncbi:MAG TPA: hypothetical protein VMX75_03980, partial [Spirochaetia bacterium]|nr:hypothetical protein [Spirochaetia bacterium]